MAKNRVLLSLIAFAAAFVFVCILLHPLLPDPLLLHADMRSEKLLLMQQWQGTANRAAFGSSHMQDGFDPRAFDAVLQGTPLAGKTINLAVPGGAQTEQRLLALRFVRTLPHNADQPLVLLELNAGANFTNDHLVHPRAINAYDWQTVRFAETLSSPQQGPAQRFGRVGYALIAWALRTANFGMLSSRIFSAPIDQAQLADETRDDRRGFSNPIPPAGQTARMQALIDTSVAHSAVSKGLVVPGFRVLAEELQRASAAPGLQLAYIVTPKIGDLAGYTTWPPCIATVQGPVPVVAVNRPDLYPQLFHDGANWVDDAHLSEQGAQLLSRAVAQQLETWHTVPQTNAACGA